MKCPDCTYGVPKIDWPQLGESVNDVRKCPVCEKLFTEEGLEYLESPDLAVEEDYDPNNSGRYFTKFCTSCEKDIHVNSIKPDPRNHDGLSSICRKCHNDNEKKRNKLKREYPTYSEDIRAYNKISRIAETTGLPPGMVRAIAEMLKE